MLGSAGSDNVQGEVQKKLDVISNEILLDASKDNPLVYVLLTVAAFFTAFYMGRQVIMVFFGKARTEAAADATGLNLDTLGRQAHAARQHIADIEQVLGAGEHLQLRTAGGVRREMGQRSARLDRGVGDIASKHTYDETPLPAETDPRRAIVLGEYGGVGWPLPGHLWNPEMRNWGYQTYQTKETYLAAFRKKIEAIIAMKPKGLCAAVYTQTSDVEGEVNGLVTYDRKVVKVEPEYMAELNRRLVGEGGRP